MKNPLLLLCLLLSVMPVSADEYRTGPVPEWVQPIDAATVRFPVEESGYGYSWSLYDYQANCSGEGQQYQHYCFKIDNSQGLTSLGQLNFGFYPDYQTLVLHYIRVRRGERTISQMERAQFKVLQRETNAEFLLYDNSKTVNVILSDLRVGDVLEYAYTITGKNPILKDSYYQEFLLQYGMPVTRIGFRVLTPESKPLYWRIRGSELDRNDPDLKAMGVSFQTRTTGGLREYAWERLNGKAKIADDRVPGWENVYPVLQFGTMNRWEEVQAWAYGVFGPMMKVTPEITRFAASLTEGLSSEEEKASEIIRFVQHDVRYLGLELGAHAYQPYPPKEVLDNRFGDCKDKTLLLHLLLKSQGIDSQLVLVNTWKQRYLDRQLPGIFCFNHVVLKMTLKDKDYWIDATNSHQTGDLSDYSGLFYARGLVISPPLGSPLIDIAPMTPREGWHSQVYETFELPQQWNGSGQLKVESRYSGHLADSTRNHFKTSPQEEIAKNYLNFYGYLFPSIETSTPLVYKDQPGSALTIEESYTISGIWNMTEESDKGDFSYYPMIITEYLKKTNRDTRSEPLSLHYPLVLEEIVTVRLADFNWGIQQDTFSVDNDYFFFSMVVSNLQKDTAIIRYKLVTKQDYVPADQIAQWNAALDQVYDEYQYTFYPDRTELGGKPLPGKLEGRAHYVAIGVLLFLFLLAGVAALILVRENLKGKRP